MRITFEIPEILVTFSCVCFMRGMYWLAGSLMFSGLCLSLFRFSLYIQKQKDNEARKIEMIREFSEGLVNIFSNYSSGPSPGSSKFH